MKFSILYFNILFLLTFFSSKINVSCTDLFCCESIFTLIADLVSCYLFRLTFFLSNYKYIIKLYVSAKRE